MAALVRRKGNVCYQVDRSDVTGGKHHPPGLHYCIQTENTEQLRVAGSECTCTLFCGCCDNILPWITCYLKMSSVRKHMKALVRYLFSGCGTNAFRMVPTARYTPWNLEHAHIGYEFLVGIFFWPMDSIIYTEAIVPYYALILFSKQGQLFRKARV
jgi:hypothetical protein